MKPSLLIASPTLRDPNFAQTVVLLWDHDEEGAIGVIVNKETELPLGEVVALPDGLDASPHADTRVLWGGPVQPDSGTVVAPGPLGGDDVWNVDGGIAVSRSMDRLLALLRSDTPFKLCVGYAGWGPGQLDDELAEGSWLWTDIDPELVFDVPMDQRWDKALATIGLAPHDVWQGAISE